MAQLKKYYLLKGRRHIRIMRQDRHSVLQCIDHLTRSFGSRKDTKGVTLGVSQKTEIQDAVLVCGCLKGGLRAQVR